MHNPIKKNKVTDFDADGGKKKNKKEYNIRQNKTEKSIYLLRYARTGWSNTTPLLAAAVGQTKLLIKAVSASIAAVMTLKNVENLSKNIIRIVNRPMISAAHFGLEKITLIKK